jgi:hypothetical protein
MTSSSSAVVVVVVVVDGIKRIPSPGLANRRLGGLVSFVGAATVTSQRHSVDVPAQ